MSRPPLSTRNLNIILSYIERDLHSNFSGSITARPNGTNGYICPAGHYCPSGATQEIECNPGTFAPIVGHGICRPCTAGFTCPNLRTIVPLPCPLGHYCESGTSSFTGEACPIGFYNPNLNQSSQADCLPCASGKYCGEKGLGNDIL